MTEIGISYKAIEFDNGEFPVVKIDSKNPRHLEVMVTFYDRKLAESYASGLGIGEEWKRLSSPAANGANGAHAGNGTEPVGTYTQKQYAVLSALKRHAVDGSAKMSRAEIAAASGVDKNSLSTILVALTQKGAIGKRLDGAFPIL